MNACNKLLWIVGIAVASTLAAAEPPPLDHQAATGANGSAPSPTWVWNSDSRETAATIPAKIRRYAQRVVKQLDHNGSGALEVGEWASLAGDPRQIDANHDGIITVDELAAYLARYARLHPLHEEDTAWRHLPQPPAVIFQPVTPADTPPASVAGEQAGTAAPSEGDSDAASAANKKTPGKGQETEAARRARKYYVAPSALPPGLPDWFIERDTNGDGQLTLDEFAPGGSSAERRQFALYDKNGDGVITPDEVVTVAKPSPEKAKASAEAKVPTEPKRKSSPSATPAAGGSASQ
jgi:hypothetical protein